MSKRLDESSMVNELKGGSLFFQQGENFRAQGVSPTSLTTNESLRQAQAIPQVSNPVEEDGAQLENSSEPHTQTPIPESTQASSNASMHARTMENVIDEIRKTVKAIGKSELYVRLTPEEKNHIVDIVYTYKRQGVKTSENEVSRIALNYLIGDYQANGQASILAQVIEALLA